MSDSNPSRFLATASGGDFGLALTRYWGGVVEAFRDEVILFGQSSAIQTKIIEAGKSHQFMMLAETPSPENHLPGTELLGQQYEFQDGTITVDDILAVHHDIPLDQMRLSHFDVMGPLSVKDGKRLAREYDQRLFNLAVLAARTASVSKNGLNVHNGGNRVTRGGASTTVALQYPVSSTGAANFRADAASLAKAMDDDFVPESGRTLYITPYIRQVLGTDPTIFDIGYSKTQNDLNQRKIGELEGFSVVVAKGRIPSTLIGTYTGTQTKYNVDASITATTATGTPVAIALCGAQEGESAIGVVQAMGISSYMAPDERRNTTFMKSQLMIGAGVMHPWCAGTIEVVGA